MNSYFEGSLSGRKIYWCPGGQGHLAYCPQPTDPDSYTYCCTFYYLGQDKPSCCLFPFHTGVVIAFIISAFVIAGLLIFLTCWCYPSCPLAKRLQQNHDEEIALQQRYLTRG
uniref:Uncharacterized protein n=1 Tax=Acrobeloides nanus TaxID=290746 RepID=A0A914EH69_9BILA